MERFLIIAPQAGMGNRLRALCSALVLGELCDRKVYHTWYEEQPSSALPRVRDMQRVGYEGLFEGLIPRWTGAKPINLCFSEWLPGSYWYQSQSSGQRRFAIDVPVKAINDDASQLMASDETVILLETSLVVKIPSIPDWESRMTAMYQRYFAPHSKYLSRSIRFEVGISVRRGELLLHYPEARQDLLAVAAWLKQLEEGRRGVVFSDEPIVCKNLRNVLGMNLYPDTTGLEDWERGFVEFLTLSLCDVVYGTPASNFAKEAAAFGGKKYLPLQEAL